jgi:hypothetical protein
VDVGGITPVGVVPVDAVVVATRVIVGDTPCKLAVMQIGHFCFSARSLNSLSSQLSPTHGVQRRKSNTVTPALEAILAHFGLVGGVSRAYFIELGVYYFLYPLL